MAKKAIQEAAAAAVLHDDESQMIAARVAALQAETKWDMPIKGGKSLTGEALQQWVLIKEDAAAQSSIERGIGFGLLKRELGHGAFEGWLSDHGINLRSAQQVMKAARLLMSLSDSNARRASLLPVRKLNVLASAPAELVDDLFNSGSLDSIEEMAREQLREIVQLRKDIEKMDQREERLNQVIAEQDEELRRSRALPKVQAHILELRRAVLDETEALRINAHQLQAILDQAALLPQDISQADLDSIAHPLMWALQGLHATVGALYERGFDTFSGYPIDLDIFPPLLKEPEFERMRRCAAEFASRAELRMAMRQADAAAATTKEAKKRGPKPKVKK